MGRACRRKVGTTVTDQTKPKKAYRVYDKAEDSDYGMLIVFAENSAQARKWGWERMDEIGAEAYIDVRARREPWADMYADTEDIPIRAYLENGWYLPCDVCWTDVTLDNVGGIQDNGFVLCEFCAKVVGLTPPEWATPVKEA